MSLLSLTLQSSWYGSHFMATTELLGTPSRLAFFTLCNFKKQGLQNIPGTVHSSSALGIPTNVCRAVECSAQEWTPWTHPLALFSLPPHILLCFFNWSKWYSIELMVYFWMFCSWHIWCKKYWSKSILHIFNYLILILVTDLIAMIQ